MDAVLGPEPACGVGDALVVEGLGDVQEAPAGLCHREYTLHSGSKWGIGFQGRAFPGSVLHHELAIAVGHPAGDPEAAGCRLAHSPADLLGRILAVELVHRLYDGLHEPACGGVVGLLGDGDDPDALRRSMDLKEMACSCLRVNLENFQTRISLKGASGLVASSSILLNSGLCRAVQFRCLWIRDYQSDAPLVNSVSTSHLERRIARM